MVSQTNLNSFGKITFIQLQFGIISPAFASGGIHVLVSSHLACLTCEGKSRLSAAVVLHIINMSHYVFKANTKITSW